MNTREAAIITAYTGILIGDIEEFHRYAEGLLGGSIFTHEFADESLWKALKESARNDFIKIKILEES